jgi:hypothetical protein
MTSSKPNSLSASHKRAAIDGTPDSRPLLTAAIREYLRRHLRRSPWFIRDEEPPFSAETASIAAFDPVENPVPPEAVAYLRSILSGLHIRALYEWLLSVNTMRYNAQMDVILLLLRWLQAEGDRDFVCQMPVARLIGERGKRMLETLIEAGADYSPHLLKDFYRKQSEMDYESWMQEVDKILRRTEERLAKGYQLYGNDAEELIRMGVLWSGELTRLYLQGCWHMSRESVIRHMPDAAYSFSLSVEDDEIKTVYDVSIKGKYDLTVKNLPFYRRRVDTARQIIRFRRRMIQAIEKVDTS